MQTFIDKTKFQFCKRTVFTCILIFSLCLVYTGFEKADANTYKVGLVLDESGLTSPYNLLAHQGLLRAQSDFGITGTVFTATGPTDYEPQLQACIDYSNDLCIAVGFLFQEVTTELAQQNPSQHFAIIDPGWLVNRANVLDITFQIDQASFLAGYLSAAVSKTGKVGVYGGMKIPGVTIFMDGYWYGNNYYNTVHNANNQIFGWNPFKLTGLFTGNFTEFNDGYQMANNLMDQGADVIFSVAGSTVGQGSAKAVQDQGFSCHIGPDIDWATAYPTYADITLTSVMKNNDVAVYDAINSLVTSQFSGGLYIGTLANDGVGLAPFSGSACPVTAQIESELASAEAAIIAGEIETRHPCSLHFGLEGLELRRCYNYLPLTSR